MVELVKQVATERRIEDLWFSTKISSADILLIIRLRFEITFHYAEAFGIYLFYM